MDPRVVLCGAIQVIIIGKNLSLLLVCVRESALLEHDLVWKLADRPSGDQDPTIAPDDVLAWSRMPRNRLVPWTCTVGKTMEILCKGLKKTKSVILKKYDDRLISSLMKCVLVFVCSHVKALDFNRGGHGSILTRYLQPWARCFTHVYPSRLSWFIWISGHIWEIVTVHAGTSIFWLSGYPGKGRTNVLPILLLWLL